MPDRLSIHEPILVNTIGHSAGALVFGILLYLFALNWRRSREAPGLQPVLAAALAMLWNIGSLIALAPGAGFVNDVLAAASFSVLSLLPAVLLRISLGADSRLLSICGYVLSSIAIALHVADLLTASERYHRAALLLMTVGFAALAVISALLKARDRNRAAGSRLLAAMGLFLFAISFVHFGSADVSQMWAGEIALHHAGLPLALLVLLQDYRFLMLDTFLRFLLNAQLAAGALLVSWRILRSEELSPHLDHPFDAGLLFAAGCLLLVLFVWLRNHMQRLLTSVLFQRSNIERPLAELREFGREGAPENEYLNNALAVAARFMGAEASAIGDTESLAPVAVHDPAQWGVQPWVQAIVPLRFRQGDGRALLLGRRRGGRRYLSEDLAALARLAAVIVERVGQLRETQLQSLMAEAELRALQAQINPHFFFNALNTLYGTISRDNAEARRLILNLADLFRYFLQSDRTFIEVEEEIKIVRSYLEIEELRLGPKFNAEIDVAPESLKVSIPVLSIQPLVENAVKHGVAARSGQGFVKLRIAAQTGGITVEVSNSGGWRSPGKDSGIGLSNVRRRLALCYGATSDVHIESSGEVTTVSFKVPIRKAPIEEPAEAATAWD